MREFFRGWRRKLGVATLAIACMLMNRWLRRFELKEGVAFGPHSPVDADILFGIHCGYVVIPLALLSAYLLLNNPRPRKPSESTKPPDEAQVTHA